MASKCNQCRQCSKSSPSIFQVIDPANRTGKIGIPAEYISQTLGKRQYIAQHMGDHIPQQHSQSQDWATRTKADYSLCLLFQKGRCKAGNQCRQIHADPKYVQSVRDRAAVGSTCCVLHGDPRANEDSYRTLTKNVPKFTLILSRTERHVLPIAALGNTQAVTKALQKGDKKLFVEKARLCRLHHQGKCRFGCDCKNFHLCRDIYNKLVETKKDSGCTFEFSFPNKERAMKSWNAAKIKKAAEKNANIPTLVVVPPPADPPALVFDLESESSTVSSIGSCGSTETSPTPPEGSNRRRSLDTEDLSRKLLPFSAAFSDCCSFPYAA